VIISREIFEYQAHVLIEKVVVQPPFRYKAIFQNEGCFLYISGQASNFSTDTQVARIKSNEAVLLKCGKYFVDWLTQHAGQAQVEIIAIHLFPEMLRKIYSHELPKLIRQRLTRRRIDTIVPDDTLVKYIENLNFYFENRQLVNDDLLELKIKELVLLLVQSKNADSVLQLLEDLFTPRVAVLHEVVDTHLYSDFSLEALAELCNLSLSSFKREFKRIYSDSPKLYMLSKKLQRAAVLLEISDRTISDIAFETGFSDPSYFARLFKSKFGKSPSEFRGQQP